MQIKDLKIPMSGSKGGFPFVPLTNVNRLYVPRKCSFVKTFAGWNLTNISEIKGSGERFLIVMFLNLCN